MLGNTATPGVRFSSHTGEPDRSAVRVPRQGGAMPGGSAELMRVLQDEHAGALWAYALRLTGGDRERAADVVQEAMLRAWRHPEVLDPTRGSAPSWLFPTPPP